MEAKQPYKTRQVIEDDRKLNTSASIASKWGEKYGLNMMQSSSLMSFEGLSLEEIVHIQNSLQSALSKEVAKFQ